MSQRSNKIMFTINNTNNSSNSFTRSIKNNKSNSNNCSNNSSNCGNNYAHRQQQQKEQQRQKLQPIYKHKSSLLLAHQKLSTPHIQHYHTTICLSFIYSLLMLCLLLFDAPECAQADWLMDCGDCHCKWNSGKKTADCKNLSLSAVPENLSSDVQVLDLSYNRIPYLEQNAFLNAQLQNLHKLFIRNSTLQQIDSGSFTQLEILIELDLSNNLLRTLQPNLFGRLIKVRALVLNGNQLDSLSDGVFQNLKYLHKIELKNNRLTRIGTQVFINVPLLSQIYLDANQLSFLRKESFESLKRLTALSMDQNPWNCTCELQIFRDFVLKRNLYTPPTSCHYPLKLRGMLWIEDQPEAFACKPKIIYPARGASINTSKENVTLICRVHASPNTMIAWDYNKQIYRATNNHNTVASASTARLASASSTSLATTAFLGQHQNQRVHIQLLRDEQSKEKEFGLDVFISSLTILGAEKSDEGIYTCLAENAGGKDAVQMSLLVQKQGTRHLLLQGNLIIVICLVVLGLLSISVFLAIVTCCIYKRFKNINGSGHHRHLYHLNMNTEHGLNSQTTTVADHEATNVVIADGTDIILDDINSTGDDISLNNYKQQYKSNLNGGTKYKYADVIQQHQVRSADNGIILSGSGGSASSDTNIIDGQHYHNHKLLTTSVSGNIVGAGGVGSAGITNNMLHEDKSYMGQNTQDTLSNLKCLHGSTQAEQNFVAIAYHTIVNASANNNSNSNSENSISISNTISNSNSNSKNNNYSKSNNSGNKFGSGSGSGSGNGRTIGLIGDSQNDIKYSISLSNNSMELIKSNSAADVNTIGKRGECNLDLLYVNKHLLEAVIAEQELNNPAKLITNTTTNCEQQLQTSDTVNYAPTRSTYKVRMQKHLFTKCDNNDGNNANNVERKRDVPSIPLNITASLMSASANHGLNTTEESIFSRLQKNQQKQQHQKRHCKSLMLHHMASRTIPTEQINNIVSGYECRQQPPPPPYHVHHGTSGSINAVGSFLSLQRRISASSTLVSAVEERSEQATLNGIELITATTMTQTIVTASPSLNFLTTTGNYTPRRQLL